MNETELIAAVQAGVDASPKSGSKWNTLEELFAASGLRGNGALNNGGGADRTTRVRQLATSKKHSGHDTRAVANHSVFVIGGESISAYERNNQHYIELIIESLKAEHPTAESCLVMVATDRAPVRPIHLVRRETENFPLDYQTWWPDLPVTLLPPVDSLDTDAAANASGVIGENVIYFGPPGTGKSTQVKKRVGTSPVFRTQFHPEYTHSDLIGSYRPVVGCEPGDAQQITGHDGEPIARPVNYFAFVPGPLTTALEAAFGKIDGEPVPEQVFFVIEEVNRGDCAAIFGDIFQLLDRDDNGRSEFSITPKPEMLAYFRSKNINFDVGGDGKLCLPPNLSLVATMNTCDQSLYPMDSAFKRRWQWIACPIDFQQLLEHTKPVRPFLDDGTSKWDWAKLLERLNKCIVLDRMEDKQLGPWFIKPGRDGEIPFEVFLNKCLFYLWHDVFRDEQLSDISPFKSDGRTVFGEVQALVREKGLSAGFKNEFLDGLAISSEPRLESIAGIAGDTSPTELTEVEQS